MFEHKTYEIILDEMLEEVRDDVDKREGSIIYDALAPIALKLAEMYSNLDVFLNLTFADTADGDYLTRRAAEFGVLRKEATPAIRKGFFRDEDGLPLEVSIGSRFSFNDLNFYIIKEVDPGEYELQAEENGIKGNIGAGTMLPIEPIENLGAADLGVVLVRGTDEESDDSLYKRFIERSQRQATSGNIYHYEQWALAVPGVGGVKVVPTWNGPNTVKVVLLNSEKLPAEPATIEKAFQHIESERPVGAIVTVAPATAIFVNVNAKLILAADTDLDETKAQFTILLAKYLGEISFTDELIRYTKIANLLLELPQVIDYENLVVNGGSSNIAPGPDGVGIAGSVSFS